MTKLRIVARDQDRELSDEELNLLVTKLVQISREASREAHLDHAIRVGSLVIHYFYGGDLQLWRSKGPKTTSFRRLAMHPELPMSASVICRCVAIFDVCQRLDVVSRWRRITLSHLRLVLRLNTSAQQQLLATANAHRWTVNQLEAEARKHHQRGGGRRPRPELTRKTELIGRLMRTLHQLQDGLPDVDAVADVIDEARVAIAASLESLERAQTLLLKVSEPARPG
jgi:hypothetical protein